jgi:hypothetical protein
VAEKPNPQGRANLLNRLKKYWKIVLLFFLLSPVTAFASGDYVLTAFLIDFVLFLVILFGIIITKIKWSGKMVLAVAYTGAMYLLFYWIDQINYLNNLALINLGSALFPPAVVYLTYISIKDKFKKSTAADFQRKDYGKE